MFQIFTENDNRPAILFRYSSSPIIANFSKRLNLGEYQCLAMKKNSQTFVFLICLIDEFIEVFANYDEERLCFKVIDVNHVKNKEDVGIEYDKVTYLDKLLLFAFKEEGWKYSSKLGRDATEELYLQLIKLDNYDSKIEELRRLEELRLRKEEEDKNAELQLAVWRSYVKEEIKLLEDAGKPFFIDPRSVDLKPSFVDVEIIPRIETVADETLLVGIVNIIGGSVVGNKIQMTYEEFENWQNKKNEENQIKDLDATICGSISIKLNVRCDGFWLARDFGKRNKLGKRFRYGEYNLENNTIDLSYEVYTPSEVTAFFQQVNNCIDFKGVRKNTTKVDFALQVITQEPAEEILKRIEVLDNKELYSDISGTGFFLGKLSKKSDDKSLRILLPGKKEGRQEALDFYEHIGGVNPVAIYPDIHRDNVLLERELNSLTKLTNPSDLLNPKLSEFIFNSSRATATEAFIGLNSEMFKQTFEYLDCKNTQMLCLNPSQLEAVVKGLYAQDLCLLQGPPGTGKTTVISELIWQHIRKNQKARLMLTSQTNMAIDNALNRLFSNSAIKIESPSWRNIMLIKPIRKAYADKVEEEGKPFTKDRIDDWVSGKDEEISSNNIVNRWMLHIASRAKSNNQHYADVINEWKQSLISPDKKMRQLFATQYLNNANLTCITCGKVDYRDPEINRGFDVTIVDEASKATPPELLLPLSYARKAVIIGDHRQLPPVIFEQDFFKKIRDIDKELETHLDNQFKHDLVDESLFKRLITHPYLSPSITSTFNIQYRMHPDINNVISQFYSKSGLNCGLDLSNVDSPDFTVRDSRFHGFSFGKFIQPNVHTIWVDVPDGKQLNGEGDSKYNEKEIEAVGLVLQALLQSDGFDRYMNYWKTHKSIETRMTESKIGIISFYAAQVSRLRSSIQSLCDYNSIKYTVNSVDKFQGQENGIIIVSTVRTNGLGFTEKPERLNVALSRARRLLIIVGNSQFFLSPKSNNDESFIYYRNVIEQIKSPYNNDIFIDYREIKTLLGYND